MASFAASAAPAPKLPPLPPPETLHDPNTVGAPHRSRAAPRSRKGGLEGTPLKLPGRGAAPSALPLRRPTDTAPVSLLLAPCSLFLRQMSLASRSFAARFAPSSPQPAPPMSSHWLLAWGV